MKDSWSFSNQYIVTIVACPFIMQYFRDRPLEKLWGEGAGEVQKKIFAQGKIKRKKIHARQLTLKNIHATA